MERVIGFKGQGQINIIDNIAISASEAGIVHYGGGDGGQNVRDAQTMAVKNLPLKYQSIAKGTDDESVVDVSAVPIRQLSGFETYNSKKGISFWATTKNTDNQLEIEGAKDVKTAHNFHSLADNFKVWGTRSVGVHFAYASQIDLKNGLIVGDRHNPTGKGISGFSASGNNHFRNLRIDGFEQGLNVPQDRNVSWNGSKIENVVFNNNVRNFAARTLSDRQTTSYPNYFEIIDSTFQIPEQNQSPTASFSSKAVGGLAFEFDASNSFDPDSSEPNLIGNGIVSYGWDFNNDGDIDKFGRQVNYYFDSIDSKDIALTVWDNQGATKTLTKTINVTQKAYDNLIIDGNFDSSFKDKGFSSSSADQGWITSHWSRNSRIGNGGAAVASGFGGNGVGQSIFDDWTRRGHQTLSMDIKNTEGNKIANQITVTVWGVNGEFKNSNWRPEGPQKAGAIPMKKTRLLQETVGGSTFDWTNFTWDLDFGNGYQFVVFQVNSTGFSPRKDMVAIDNIQIS